MILVSMFTHVQKYFEYFGAYIDHLPNDFKCANTWKLWWIHEFFPSKNSSRNGSVLETVGKPVHHVLHEAVNDQSKICLLRVKPDALLTSEATFQTLILMIDKLSISLDVLNSQITNQTVLFMWVCLKCGIPKSCDHFPDLAVTGAGIAIDSYWWSCIPLHNIPIKLLIAR